MSPAFHQDSGKAGIHRTSKTAPKALMERFEMMQASEESNREKFDAMEGRFQQFDHRIATIEQRRAARSRSSKRFSEALGPVMEDEPVARQNLGSTRSPRFEKEISGLEAQLLEKNEALDQALSQYDKLNADLSEAKQTHQSDMEEATKKFQETEASLEEAANSLQEKKYLDWKNDSAHDDELRKVTSLHESVQEINELKRAHEELQAKMTDEHRVEITDANKSHEEALAQIQESHQEALAQANKSHDEALVQANESHKKALAQAQKANEDTLAQAKKSNEEAQKSNDEALAQVKEEHINELRNTTSKHDSILETNSEIETLKSELHESQAALIQAKQTHDDELRNATSTHDLVVDV